VFIPPNHLSLHPEKRRDKNGKFAIGSPYSPKYASHFLLKFCFHFEECVELGRSRMMNTHSELTRAPIVGLTVWTCYLFNLHVMTFDVLKFVFE
jgi:hypothetical protein